MNGENPDEPPMLGPGPLTLEMADKWMRWLEDVATIERDLGAATRFLLGNLIFALSRSGALDGQQFLLHLRERIPQLPHPGAQLAAKALIDDFLLQFQAATHDASEASLH